MKLVDVFNALGTSAEKPTSAWQSMANLKKPPKLAYKLLKYGAKLAAEYDVIEKQRVKLIYETTGKEAGSEVRIEPGTAEFAAFIEAFNGFLGTESDLEPTGVGMDALIDALDSEKGNVLSEADLAALEPFFTEKPGADLKLVG